MLRFGKNREKPFFDLTIGQNQIFFRPLFEVSILTYILLHSTNIFVIITSISIATEFSDSLRDLSLKVGLIVHKYGGDSLT
jgi:hypothetical protein